MDKLKIRQATDAATKSYNLLTQAIDHNDNRAIGRELQNLGRELQLLNRLVDDPLTKRLATK